MQNKKEVADAMFGAIDVIIDRKLQKLNFDYTVIAKVVKKYEDGTYDIEYQNAKFRAAAVGGTQYTIGEHVYVAFPGASSSSLKFIYSAVKAKPQAATYNNFNLQRQVNKLQAQQETLIAALTLAFDGDIAAAKEKIQEIEGGN